MDLEEVFEGHGTYRKGDVFIPAHNAEWHGAKYSWTVGGVFEDGAYEMWRILEDGKLVDTQEFTDKDIEKFKLSLVSGPSYDKIKSEQNKHDPYKPYYDWSIFGGRA